MDIKLRLLTPTNKECFRTLPLSSSIAFLKAQLLANWPAEFENYPSKGILRLIYSGKILEDHLTLEECKFSPHHQATIHVVSSSPQNPINHPKPSETTPLPAENQNQNPNIPEGEGHFHACVFNEKEYSEISRIFQSKTDSDGLLPYSELMKFLDKYWWYLRHEHFIPEETPFPVQKLENIWKKICNSALPQPLPTVNSRIGKKRSPPAKNNDHGENESSPSFFLFLCLTENFY